jgi:hypothetical protein
MKELSEIYKIRHVVQAAQQELRNLDEKKNFFTPVEMHTTKEKLIKLITEAKIKLLELELNNV